MPDDARSLSLVTIFFEAEVGLMELQARSLARFHAPSAFEEVLVIDNTRRGITARTHARLDREFGGWAPRVRYLRPEEITELPVAPGWVGQQILKLQVHRQVTSEHYVVLDAKNHWNQPTDLDTFLAPDGRARGASHSYRGHALEDRVVEVMRYLGVDPEGWIDHFPVTHTPVVLSRRVVAELVEAVGSRSGRTFAVEFARADLLEFPLYAAWIISRHGTLDGHVDGSTVRSTTIWPSMDTERLAAAARESTRLDSPFLAVHRKALARAGLASSRVLADLWVARGLFPNRRHALVFIAAFKVHYLQSMSARRVHQRLDAARTERTT